MKLKILIFGIIMGILFVNGKANDGKTEDKFEFFVEQFADLKILRYQVPEFDTKTSTNLQF